MIHLVRHTVDSLYRMFSSIDKPSCPKMRTAGYIFFLTIHFHANFHMERIVWWWSIAHTQSVTHKLNRLDCFEGGPTCKWKAYFSLVQNCVFYCNQMEMIFHLSNQIHQAEHHHSRQLLQMLRLFARNLFPHDTANTSEKKKHEGKMIFFSFHSVIGDLIICWRIKTYHVIVYMWAIFREETSNCVCNIFRWSYG